MVLVSYNHPFYIYNKRAHFILKGTKCARLFRGTTQISIYRENKKAFHPHYGTKYLYFAMPPKSLHILTLFRYEALSLISYLYNVRTRHQLLHLFRLASHEAIPFVYNVPDLTPTLARCNMLTKVLFSIIDYHY